MELASAASPTLVTAPMDVVAVKIDPANVLSSVTIGMSISVNDEVAVLNDDPADDAKLSPQKVAPAEPVPRIPKFVIPDAAANPPEDIAPKLAEVNPVTAVANSVDAFSAP